MQRRLCITLQQKVRPRSFVVVRMASTRSQTEVWQAPVQQESPAVLKVINSLTRSKTELVPLKPSLLSWYTCGPTVYDDSHMGHARNYVTQDIIRRILRDYFGYNIHFVMNITDIDDKVCGRPPRCCRSACSPNGMIDHSKSKTELSLSRVFSSTSFSDWSAIARYRDCVVGVSGKELATPSSS